MDKKEILAKAQAEKADERETFIVDKSMKWTYLAMVLLADIFTIVRACRDMPSTDLGATVALSIAAGFLYRFVKTKEKFNLIVGIVMIICGTLAAVRFFMGY